MDIFQIRSEFLRYILTTITKCIKKLNQPDISLYLLNLYDKFAIKTVMYPQDFYITQMSIIKTKDEHEFIEWLEII